MSLAGRHGQLFRSPYAASKWGMIGLTQTLSMEVGKYNICVNCIAPGAVIGERIENVIQARAHALGISRDEISSRILSRVSLDRFLTPAEVAGAAVFLVSDEASGITGHTLAVDAGRTGL